MRALDRKFAIEGDRLVKIQTGEPVPDGEPVFILRARDRLAAAALHDYLDLCRRDQCGAEQLLGVALALNDFLQYRNAHLGQLKQPGCTLVEGDMPIISPAGTEVQAPGPRRPTGFWTPSEDLKAKIAHLGIGQINCPTCGGAASRYARDEQCREIFINCPKCGDYKEGAFDIVK